MYKHINISPHTHTKQPLFIKNMSITNNLSMNPLVKYNDQAHDIQDSNGDGNTWFTSMLDVKKKNQILGVAMSEKELKIRNELEMEVERDLEEEIKEGLCNLSLRLHRLYQRQKEREQQVKEAISEVNISIKLEGKCTKVQIKDSSYKKEVTYDDTKRGHYSHRRRRSWSHNNRSQDVKQTLVCGLNGKKVDWEKSLRACSGNTVSVNRANNGSSNRVSDKGIITNIEGRRVKQQGNKVDRKPLELGWKV